MTEELNIPLAIAWIINKARNYGYSGDYSEVRAFIKSVLMDEGLNPSEFDLTVIRPYEIEIAKIGECEGCLAGRWLNLYRFPDDACQCRKPEWLCSSCFTRQAIRDC